MKPTPETCMVVLHKTSTQNVHDRTTLNQHPELRWVLLSCRLLLSPEIRNTFKLVTVIIL